MIQSLKTTNHSGRTTRVNYIEEHSEEKTGEGGEQLVLRIDKIGNKPYSMKAKC